MKDLKSLILKELRRKSQLKTSEISEKYGISRQAVHRHLRALVRQGTVLKQGSSRKGTFYILNDAKAKQKIGGKEKHFNKLVKAQGLDEGRLYEDLSSQAGLLNNLSPPAKTNFHYAFTEMINNAIDHSHTKLISIKTNTNRRTASFWVIDTGIGIFANILEKKGLASELEAIQDLLKGKQTTMPEKHSGEGIFFTSKIADRFIIESHRKRLTIDNILEDIIVATIRFRKGTHVFFEIASDSSKSLHQLFQKFTGENYQFDKSLAKISLYQGQEPYISRSQAKRLLHSMDRFKEIILDFKGVPAIGQAFADEIFRVFQNAHPDIKIEAIHCNEDVEFMVKRAQAHT